MMELIERMSVISIGLAAQTAAALEVSSGSSSTGGIIEFAVQYGLGVGVLIWIVYYFVQTQDKERARHREEVTDLVKENRELRDRLISAIQSGRGEE